MADKVNTPAWVEETSSTDEGAIHWQAAPAEEKKREHSSPAPSGNIWLPGPYTQRMMPVARYRFPVRLIRQGHGCKIIHPSAANAPAPPKPPTESPVERAQRFREIMARENLGTRTALARHLGVSRAWVTKALATELAEEPQSS